MPKVIRKDSGTGGANWILSYSDMVTLLLAFFVMLYALSNVDNSRFNEFIATFAGAPFILTSPLDGGFGIHSDGGAEAGEVMPEGAELLAPEQADINRQFDTLYGQIEGYIDANGLDGTMTAHRDGHTITIRFHDRMLFDSGRAVLRPESFDAIAQVKALLWEQQASYASLRIEGHTDDIPIGTAQYPSNWYLSTARAMAVMDRFLSDDAMNIDPVKLSAVGLSEYHPIADNGTDEGRAQNRRVDIVIERRNVQ